MLKRFMKWLGRSGWKALLAAGAVLAFVLMPLKWFLQRALERKIDPIGPSEEELDRVVADAIRERKENEKKRKDAIDGNPFRSDDWVRDAEDISSDRVSHPGRDDPAGDDS